MIDGLDLFVNAIANGGILGSCEKFCGYLPTKEEFAVCDLICSAVGVEALIRALNVSNPDPAHVCEEIKMCFSTNSAQAKITQVQTVPASGPIGTTFDITMFFDVLSETGVTVFELLVTPEDKKIEPFGVTGVEVDMKPGNYSVEFQLPTKQMDVPAGFYNSTLAICENYCGTKNSYLLDMAYTNFTITPK